MDSQDIQLVLAGQSPVSEEPDTSVRIHHEAIVTAFDAGSDLLDLAGLTASGILERLGHLATEVGREGRLANKELMVFYYFGHGLRVRVPERNGRHSRWHHALQCRPEKSENRNDYDYYVQSDLELGKPGHRV